MALLLGRIRRISLDAGTPTNYTLQATTTYVAATPAVSPSSWGSSAAILGMDQLLSVPAPPAVEVTGNMGALVTFTRFPKYMTGVIVKVRPTYDESAGQDPYLEYWTYDNIVAAWTLRQSVALRSEFDGVKSGRLKYFDFRTDTRLENVTAVWVTLKEGAVAGATLSWLAVHVFGACDRSTTGGGGGGLDPNDPGCTSSDCITPDPCEGQPESCVPTEDTCRDLAIRYGYDPDICDLTPDPDWDIPEFPLIDFCDPVAMAAFRATLTPLQLSWLEELLEAVELPCLVPIVDKPGGDPIRQPDPVAPINADPDGEKVLPKQPIEVYMDPETLESGDDPRDRDRPKPETVTGLRTKRFILTWSGNDAVEALALVTSAVAPIIGLDAPAVEGDPQIFQRNWGPDVGVSTVGFTFTPAVYGLKVNLSNLPFTAQVGIRVQTLRLRGSTSLQDSVNHDGVYTGAAAGGCLPQPDWILSRSSHLRLPSRSLINESFYELFYSNLFSAAGTAAITLELPRETSTQNDASVCTGAFKARSRLGDQRSGCLIGFTAKLRQRWLYPFETATYDAVTDYGDYLYHRRPYVLVVDVAIKQIANGPGFAVSGVGVTMDVTTLKDAQPIESCA